MESAWEVVLEPLWDDEESVPCDQPEEPPVRNLLPSLSVWYSRTRLREWATPENPTAILGSLNPMALKDCAIPGRATAGGASDKVAAGVGSAVGSMEGIITAGAPIALVGVSPNWWPSCQGCPSTRA